MPTIDPDKVSHVIVKARALDAKVEAIDPDPASNMTDDDMLEVIADGVDDATGQELLEFINGMNVDERAELVALAWIGRGSFSKEEWDEAVEEARAEHPTRTAEYLLDLPLLGDYLAEGMAEFGHTIED